MKVVNSDNFINNQSNCEQVNYGILRLNQFADYVEKLEESQDSIEGITILNPKKLLKYIHDSIADLNTVDKLNFEGYFVDRVNDIYTYKASEALREIARRLPKIFLHGDNLGSMTTLPSYYLDMGIDDIIASSMEELTKQCLVPFTVKIRMVSGKKAYLKFGDDNLLPIRLTDDADLTAKELIETIKDHIVELDDTPQDVQ